MSKYHLPVILFFAFLANCDLMGISTSRCYTAEAEELIQDTMLNNQILYNGRIWRNIYYKVKDDQFLFTNQFLPGTVSISNRTFKNTEIRYDIYNDEIMISTNNGLILQLNKELVDSFSIVYQNKSYHFTRLKEDSIRGFKGYINVLYDGTTPVYVKYRKEISMLAVDGKFDLFNQYHRIFVILNNNIIQVNRRREFFRLLINNKLEIKTYIKKNRSNISLKTPESFVPLIQYFDSLSL